MKTSIILTTTLILFTITSCGSIVDRFHRQLDQGMAKMQPTYTPSYSKKTKKFDPYAKSRTPSQNKYSTRTHNHIKPAVRRYYQPVGTVRKRYVATDLNDNDNNGSLWSGSNKTSDLFSVDSFKRNGDIILIEVKAKLKTEITEELKRAFPVRGMANKTAAPAPAPAANDAKTIHDKVSSVIIEEIKEEYLLIKGRKTLLFNGRKRMVEIQALVARRDLTDIDTIDSNNILESTINIVR